MAEKRIDKLLTTAGLLSRSEARKACRAGRIAVNGVQEASPDRRLNDNDVLTLDGVPVGREEFFYLMLNKPAGYVCANEDGKSKTVFDLLDEKDRRRDWFTVGRLDKYTVGLLLISNDGTLAHDLLSPRHHVEKTYFFRCASPLNTADVQAFAAGMTIDGGEVLLPAVLSVGEDSCSGTVSVCEGKYHQIKRMFVIRRNKITYLQRLTFGPLVLDNALNEGNYRFLTPNEVFLLMRATGK